MLEFGKDGYENAKIWFDDFSLIYSSTNRVSLTQFVWLKNVIDIIVTVNYIEFHKLYYLQLKTFLGWILYRPWRGEILLWKKVSNRRWNADTILSSWYYWSTSQGIHTTWTWKFKYTALLNKLYIRPKFALIFENDPPRVPYLDWADFSTFEAPSSFC